MTTDTAALISANEPWRQDEAAKDRLFPYQTDTTLIVVDGETSELAEDGARRLSAALAQDKAHFDRVERPDGGAFFESEGLLFRSRGEVSEALKQLIAAEGFLGPLAADPSLRGVMDGIKTLALGVKTGQTDWRSVERPITSLARALNAASEGRRAPFSWQALIGGPGPMSAPVRRLILVKPKLAYDELEPGAPASAAIRAAAARLGLTPQEGVTVRLTGPTPLSDEEFASLQDHAWLVGGVMLAAMLSMLWLAVRSVRVLIAILVTTIAGLVLTAAAGLLAVGRFNLISVAFIPLFVGLGVDFGIQFCVRFRAERLMIADVSTALVAAGRAMGGALTLAAGAITLGFFAFAPTAYVGVSELGVIAGVGMVIALALALTLLPALLTLLRPPLQVEPVGWAAVAGLDRFLIRRRQWVLFAFAASMAGSICLLPLVRFDFNPLHLKNPKSEAMTTLKALEADPSQSPNPIDVLAPDLRAADRLAARLSALPEVAQVVTLSSFIPEDQAPKLAAVADANTLLDVALNPFDVSPPPSDAERAASLRAAAVGLGDALTVAPQGRSADAARALKRALETLAAGPPERRALADRVVSAPLAVALDQIRALLKAQPVSHNALPPELKADWIASDGQARIEVFPKSAADNAALERFGDAVKRLAPHASGGPISIIAAGRTISIAFIEAGLLSLVVITLLLFAALRNIREVLFTLAPVVLSGFLTLGSCVLIGQPINFANIIAFPLLFGVGVAFHIYFVMAWRDGARDLLQSPLARAVLFSALTTGAAFGALMISSHPGTASMGKILMIALVWTLVCALIFEPALLGPPRLKGADEG